MIRKSMPLALVLCLGAPVACAQADNDAIVIELEDFVGGLVTADVTVNGVTRPMIFDTGGGATLMTPEFATAAGCNPWGRAVGHRMRGEEVEAQICGPMEFSVEGASVDDEVGVFDLSALLPPDLPPVGGILALSAFDDRVVTFDLGTRELTLESDTSLAARVGDDPGTPLRLQRELTGVALTPFVPIATTPGPLWFLVDSGNLGPVFVAPHATVILEATGLLTREGTSEEESLTMDLEFGDFARADASAAEVDILYDGVIGEPVLRSVVITFDFAGQRFWVSNSTSAE